MPCCIGESSYACATNLIPFLVHAFQPNFPPVHRFAPRVLQGDGVIDFPHLAGPLLNHASDTVTNFSLCAATTCHFMANAYASIAFLLVQGCDDLIERFHTNQFARPEIKHRNGCSFGVRSAKSAVSRNRTMNPQLKPAKEELGSPENGKIMLANLTKRNSHEPGFHFAGKGFGRPEQLGRLAEIALLVDF